jgi:hypothetical protein
MAAAVVDAGALAGAAAAGDATRAVSIADPTQEVAAIKLASPKAIRACMSPLGNCEHAGLSREAVVIRLTANAGMKAAPRRFQPKPCCRNAAGGLI